MSSPMKAGIGEDTGLASFAAKTEIIARTRIVTPEGNGISGERKIAASVLNRECMGGEWRASLREHCATATASL